MKLNSFEQGIFSGDRFDDEDDWEPTEADLARQKSEAERFQKEEERRVARDELSRTHVTARNQLLLQKVEEVKKYTVDEAALGRFYQNIHPDALAKHGKQDTFFLKMALLEFERSPETQRLFEEIFLNGNYAVLKEKTAKQLEGFRKFYDAENAQYTEQERISKLQHFQEWARNLTPVRNDSNKTLTEFKSPKLTGNYEHSSVGGYDALAQAHNYVYATFNEIPHPMSGPVEGRTRIDEQDIEDRAEILMQDIADLVTNTTDPIIRRYVDNIFDYKQGKELIALYAALVFKDVAEANEFFARRAGDRLYAEKWDQGNYSESNVEAVRIREEEIVERMKQLLQLFNIEPPLSLEVRIKDSAKVEMKKYGTARE